VAFDTETNQCVIIKVLDTRRADEMAQEVAVHEFIPSDEPRLIKAIQYVQSYHGMPAFPLEGDGSILHSYNYLVMPLIG